MDEIARYRHPRLRVAIAAICVAIVLPLSGTAAQIVRGTVREAATAAPVTGVVITLEGAGDGLSATSTATVNVLSDELGNYAVRAPAAGQYRVIAKRIGTRRFTSDVFALAIGETKQVDIQLTPVMPTLPTVMVSAMQLCVARNEQGPRVASLWDEARAALQATAIAQRSRNAGMRLVRYSRVLDPRSLRVLREERSEHATALTGQFSSLNADSISRIGFWRQLEGDSAAFYVPDAEVLLSNAFLRDHCFSVVDGRGEHADHVGLSFGPAPERYVNDIRGTMWIHARSFELQSVEFRYTQVPSAPNSERNGGEVRFARMSNGAWYVKRWYARMPQFARNNTNPGARNLAFNVLTVYRTIEEGGEVTATGSTDARLFSVRGVVHDSVGASVADATVELAGTAFRTRTGVDGRFSMSSVPPGRYVVALPWPGYAQYGVPAAAQEVVLEERGAELTLRASNTRGLVERLCAGRTTGAGRATLRVVLADSSSGKPPHGLELRARWTEYGEPVMGLRPVRSRSLHATTDTAGAAVFCDLSGSAAVTLELMLHNEQGRSLGVHRFRPEQITVLTLRTPTP